MSASACECVCVRVGEGVQWRKIERAKTFWTYLKSR